MTGTPEQVSGLLHEAGENHIHSVWRDYRNDLGHDLLADHYERERTTGHHLTSRLNVVDRR